MRLSAINYKHLWTVFLTLYIVCSSAFSSGDLSFLNTFTLYAFLGVSALGMIISGRLRVNLTVISLILYCLLMIVGVLYTPASSSQCREVIYYFITMAVLVICVVQYVDTVEDIRHIMFAYMLAGLVLAVYVYAQYGNEFWDLMKESANDNVDNAIRVGEELANVNVIGMYTAISMLIAVYFLLYTPTMKLSRFLCVGVIVFCFIVAMSSASKKTLVLIFVGLFGMFWYSSLGKKAFGKKLQGLILTGGAIYLILYLVQNLSVFSGIMIRYESTFDYLMGGSGTASDVARMNMIRRGLEIWQQHFFLGAGTAASIYHFGVYSHNNFVEILMNSGIVGFLIFYWGYLVSGVKYMHNIVRYRNKDNVSILLFALFFSVTACGFGLVYYYERYYMMLFAVIFSATKILARREKPAD